MFLVDLFFRRKVLVTHENSNIDITGEILQCLRPGAWLNDEVLLYASYLALVVIENTVMEME